MNEVLLFCALATPIGILWFLFCRWALNRAAIIKPRKTKGDKGEGMKAIDKLGDCPYCKVYEYRASGELAGYAYYKCLLQPHDDYPEENEDCCSIKDGIVCPLTQTQGIAWHTQSRSSAWDMIDKEVKE